MRDGQTIVIGGLIAESKVTTSNEIPLLGKLPLLGRLFRSDVVSIQRKELVLIITPHVVRTEAELRAISERRRMNSAFDKVPADIEAGPGQPQSRLKSALRSLLKPGG